MGKSSEETALGPNKHHLQPLYTVLILETHALRGLKSPFCRAPNLSCLFQSEQPFGGGLLLHQAPVIPSVPHPCAVAHVSPLLIHDALGSHLIWTQDPSQNMSFPRRLPERKLSFKCGKLPSDLLLDNVLCHCGTRGPKHTEMQQP